MCKYSMFHIPVMSFFSKDLYKDIALNWKGTNFLYLFLLLVLCLLPGMYKVHTSLSDFTANEAPKLISQIPVISITDGQLSLNAPQPYSITDPKTKDLIAIIDTTGTITSLDDTEAVILMTKTQALYKKNKLQTQTFEFSAIPDFTLKQEMITQWMNTLKKFVVPVLFSLALIFSFFFRILQALIYAALGMIFVSALNSDLTYGCVVRLAVTAVTPCIILRTILSTAGILLPLMFLWCFVITMGYLFYGVKAATSQDI